MLSNYSVVKQGVGNPRENIYTAEYLAFPGGPIAASPELSVAIVK
jgi:hypothetical protein